MSHSVVLVVSLVVVLAMSLVTMVAHVPCVLAADETPLPGIPASIMPRIRALERAFGIGEVARQRAPLAESANSVNNTATRSIANMIDQSGSPCGSSSCSSCGGLNIASLGSSSPLIGSAPDGTGTDYYGLTMCNSGSLSFTPPGSTLPQSCSAGTVFCQYHAGDGSTYTIASSTATPTWTYTNNQVGYFQTGAGCVTDGVPRAMQITFSCGSGADSITSITAPTATPSYCTWTVAVSTSLVCGVTADTLASGGGGGGDSKNGGGLSGGWVFIIILIVFTAVYLIGGALFMHFKRGAVTAGDHCPNAEFWKDLPSLVKDGCLFTFARVRGLCGGYSTV